MQQLTNRQETILEFIQGKHQISNKEIKNHLEEKTQKSINRVTIIRDLEILIKNDFIKKNGQGRSTSYSLKIQNPLLFFLNPEKYFKKPLTRRNARENFNFDIFKNFNNSIFSEEKLEELENINIDYLKRKKGLSQTIIKKEFERLTIELSWKSSQIEGNTYSLIETETLIKENHEAEGHTKSEAQMILNHKKALDYIIENPKNFKKVTLNKIENLHQLLTFDLGVEKNIRKTLVGITGTIYKPIDNQYQIKEVLHNLILIINNKNIHPIIKALSTLTLISYIQPFEDGNKRTARILSNAVLMANNYCPLSYRSVNENDYKKAILLFYEQNNLYFLKKLFIHQFKSSINTYFLA